jgi:hypothetical protein
MLTLFVLLAAWASWRELFVRMENKKSTDHCSTLEPTARLWKID